MELLACGFILACVLSGTAAVTEECSGPSFNAIEVVIKDVNWEALANQLDLVNKLGSIEVGCASERKANKASCYLREMVKEFVHSQPHESCDKTVEKIAQGLDELGITKEASQLREKFGLVTSDEGTCTDLGDCSSLPEPPKPTSPDPPQFHLSEKRGLAILVSIDYIDYPYPDELGPLEGTNADAEEMEITFKRLGYDIHKLQNKEASEDAITALVEQAAQYLKEYKGKTTDKVIMFAFSGHGSSSDTIITHDGIFLSLWRDIIKPLVYNSDIKIPKFFLIDACRGNEELIAKDGSNHHKSLRDQVKGVLKEETNFRIEYATILNHTSYIHDFESAWMPVLAWKLREDDDSFQNIAAKVHKKVQERKPQQCESIDRLNTGPIYLKEEGLGLTVE